MSYELADRVREIPAAATLEAFCAGIPDSLLTELIEAGAAGMPGGNRTKDQGAGLLLFAVRASAPDSDTITATLETIAARTGAAVVFATLEHMRREGHALIIWPDNIDGQPQIALTASGMEHRDYLRMAEAIEKGEVTP